MVSVNFKSTPENYLKEASGLKNNTVRKKDNDCRFKILRDFSPEEITIRITNSENGHFFERKLRDVNFFEDLVVLTW